MAESYKIMAQLVAPNGEAIKEGTLVRIWDEDLFSDDEMGTDRVAQKGRVELTFELSAIRSLANPFETEPDIYFVIESGPFKGYRSKTIQDVELSYEHPVTGITYHTTDLGTVMVYPHPDAEQAEAPEIFLVEGQLSTPTPYPLNALRVAVVSDDWLRDDLIGVGFASKEGRFRLSFTQEEFNQDWGPDKALPDLYVVVSTVIDGALQAIQKFEFPHLTFSQGAEDLGELAITHWSAEEPLADESLEATPGWKKRVDRLEVDTELVKACLVEVTPLVEQLTGWRGLLDQLNIAVVDNSGEYLVKDLADLLDVEEDSWLAKFSKVIMNRYASFAGLYDPIRHTLVINSHVMEDHNLDALKVVIGHELVHVGQFKFHPELVEEHKHRLAQVKELISSGEISELSTEEMREKLESLGFQSQMKELEGYAYYIQKDFLEKYYHLATFFSHPSWFTALVQSILELIDADEGLNELQSLKLEQYVEGAERYRGTSSGGPVRFRS